MASILPPYHGSDPPKLSPSRRTNSLAFAKSDCHTCSALSLRCDRQRPRCTICQSSGRMCNGYSMQLTWQQSHSAANKPPKVRKVAHLASSDSSESQRIGAAPGSASTVPTTTGPREFTFVAGRPAKRRRRHAPDNAMERKDLFAASGLRLSRSLGSLQSSETRCDVLPFTTYRTGFPDLPPEPLSPSQEPALPAGPWSSTQPDLELVPEVESDSPDTESVEQCLQIQHAGLGSVAWSQTTPGSTGDSWSEAGYFSGSECVHQANRSHISQMCFATLHDKFSGLLDMYDQEFCKYPITNDFGVNPYRYRPDTTRGSQHLLHSLLAFASHFRLRSPTQSLPPPETLVHKNTAMTLYQGSLASFKSLNDSLTLLDTALILWQLEVCTSAMEIIQAERADPGSTRKATISALNIWKSHLTDAYALLEFCGGVRKWTTIRKANVQVSMILWWDTMVSLLAREECTLPYAYLEAVLKSEGGQPWTFYELNGCPRELFVPMVQLANLSAQTPSKTATRLVAEIEQSVKQYKYPGQGLNIDSDDEEAMHTQRDQYHCCEGFRYALLVYILRVFTTPAQKKQQRTRARISFLSRVCLDHVAACRSTSLIQKQLLFPVFIAGSETRNIAHREFAEEYCRRWYRKFGYQMYMTVLDVLGAVWTGQDSGNEDYWWGDELDTRRAKEGAFVQFCFG